MKGFICKLFKKRKSEETVSQKPVSEETSETIASLAARGLANPELLTLEEFRRICASALTQKP
jgi:hypothetical protein